MLNISVDNSFRLYFDGVQQLLQHADNWTLCDRLLLPGTTQVIAIAGHNNEWAAGVLASSDDLTVITPCSNTNSTPSGAVWKCTNKAPTDDSWTRPGFNDSAWWLAVPSEANVDGTSRGAVPCVSAAACWIWSNCIVTPPGQTKITGWDVDAYCRLQRY